MDIAKLNLTEKLESLLLQHEQAKAPVTHRFREGVYIREVFLPKGTIAVGHKQKTKHLNVFLKGCITMLSEEAPPKTITAPMVFVSPPGKKVGYIEEDTVWLNVYITDETDVETLEEMYLDKSEAWESTSNPIAIPDKETDQLDYKNLLEELNLTEEEVQLEVSNKEDLIPLPIGDYKFAISDSSLSGKGVFATADIEPDEVIAPAKLGNNRTSVGRYTNHSATPNAMMVTRDDDIFLVALEKIEGCRGGFYTTEITTNYRNTIKLLGGPRCHQLQQ